MILIKKITDLDGNEKLSHDYLERKGCICKPCFMKIGIPMLLEYFKDSNKLPKFGYLKTATVVDIKQNRDETIVRTLNSIYHLQKVED